MQASRVEIKAGEKWWEKGTAPNMKVWCGLALVLMCLMPQFMLSFVPAVRPTGYCDWAVMILLRLCPRRLSTLWKSFSAKWWAKCVLCDGTCATPCLAWQAAAGLKVSANTYQ